MKNIFKILILFILLLTVIFFISFHSNFYEEIDKKIIPSYFFAFICLEFAFIVISFLYFILSPIINYVYTKIIEYKYRKNINFEYYRDIIKNYSIGALCTCYGKHVNYKDLLVATLLRLNIENKISITNEGINVIDEQNLSQSEMNLIKSLTGTVIYTKQNVSKRLKKDINYDFRISDLYSEKRPIWADIILVIDIILYFINFILLICLEEKMVFVIIWCALWIIVPLHINLFNKPYLNINEKGLEIKYKLIGIKNFLEDYSSIEEKSIEDIALWDYYIVYGIIFNLKGLLNKDAKKTYIKYYNLLKNKV